MRSRSRTARLRGDSGGAVRRGHTAGGTMTVTELPPSTVGRTSSGSVAHATSPLSSIRQAYSRPAELDQCQPRSHEGTRHCGGRTESRGDGTGRGSTQWRGGVPRRIVPDLDSRLHQLRRSTGFPTDRQLRLSTCPRGVHQPSTTIRTRRRRPPWRGSFGPRPARVDRHRQASAPGFGGPVPEPRGLSAPAQPGEIVDRQVEIGDAEAADEDWLAEVQTHAAVGASAE
jgi:hypothetical protein